jgi:hypothetical protein
MDCLIRLRNSLKRPAIGLGCLVVLLLVSCGGGGGGTGGAGGTAASSWDTMVWDQGTWL